MIRLNMIVEGLTEKNFVKEALQAYLTPGVQTSVRMVETGRRGPLVFKGGMTTYAKARKDIRNWLKEDRKRDARFTTMFDLYALPKDFPGMEEAPRHADPYKRVRFLEEAFGQDMGDWRFIPYLQLHEFEALLLVRPNALTTYYSDRGEAIDRLIEIRAGFASPELIDDGPNSAPSKRIIECIPEYGDEKATVGPLTASCIGVPTLLEECAHFREWIEKLQALADA